MGDPWLHTTRRMLPTGQDPLTTLQVTFLVGITFKRGTGALWGLPREGGSGVSSHSSGLSAPSTGSVHKSRVLELVPALQMWDDLRTQSGCSHSTF